MKGISSIYLGRHVSKENFRAFIYGPNGSQKLVNSWDEFERDMASGTWFATIEETKVEVKEKPKRVRKEVVKGVLGEIQDDFLPKASE